MKKLISVIMAVYKEDEDMLMESISSILNQTYRNFEFIIVIDNPDDTWRKDFIEKFKDNRIKLIVNDINMGLPNTLNKALQYAKGDYIARMDADDISKINRFEKQIEFLEKTDCDLCGSNFYTFYNKSEIKTVIMPQFDLSIKNMLKYTNCIGHPTWFGKRNVFLKNNGYRNIFSCEDYDFLLRCAKNKFILGNIQEELLYYRLNDKSISRKNAGKQIVLANFLARNFRRGNITLEEEIEKFILLKKTQKEIDKYNKYSQLKQERNINEKKGLNNFIIILKMIFFMKFFFKDLFRILYKKYVLYVDKKEIYGKRTD